MAKPWRQRDPEHTRKVRSFLRDAFSDYIAARVLFLAQLPQQGAILSSTAIEKSIKAMLAFRGNESRGHLKTAHWNALCDFDAGLSTALDRDFIELNQKAYSLRYTDELPIDFNLVIASREFLAEMDHTVHSIMSCLHVEENGVRQQTLFEVAIKASDNRILAENHLISGPRKDLFAIQKPQLVYEVRRDPIRGLFEVTYTTADHPKRAGFLRAGLVPEDEARRGYEFSHFPVSGADAHTDHDISLTQLQ